MSVAIPTIPKKPEWNILVVVQGRSSEEKPIVFVITGNTD